MIHYMLSDSGLVHSSGDRITTEGVKRRGRCSLALPPWKHLQDVSPGLRGRQREWRLLPRATEGEKCRLLALRGDYGGVWPGACRGRRRGGRGVLVRLDRATSVQQ